MATAQVTGASPWSHLRTVRAATPKCPAHHEPGRPKNSRSARNVAAVITTGSGTDEPEAREYAARQDLASAARLRTLAEHAEQEAIVAADRAGMSAYRIAKIINRSDTGVRNILRKLQQ